MPINSLNNLTNKTSGSISKLFGTNKILNQTIGGALQSGIALVEQFNQIELNASTLVYKAQQIMLWGLSNKNYDNLAVEQAFLPGNYGKINAVTNPTPKRNYISENKIQLNLDRNALYAGNSGKISDLDKEINNDFNGTTPNKMFVYIKFKDSYDMWWLLKLRATIADNPISDNFNNNWNPFSAFGRTQKNYVYSETERKMSLNLHEYAYSKNELDFFYQKLDTLAKLNFGHSETANATEFSLKSGVVIYISIGNLYKDLPAIINSMKFDFDSNAWDMNVFKPTRVNINIDMTIVHYTNINFDSQIYNYTLPNNGARPDNDLYVSNELNKNVQSNGILNPNLNQNLGQ